MKCHLMQNRLALRPFCHNIQTSLSELLQISETYKMRISSRTKVVHIYSFKRSQAEQLYIFYTTSLIVSIEQPRQQKRELI